ncbi:3-dehydroquinate synthase [Geopsychrobacter electrodiphilus]|uniref:3-dehydroquinate synthase n=1 Tax=Geopsychrobacter electrodiphilus TaxID=225196 RepID=UPI000367AA00|nr:3-dehydroquinate synthase [Geopsychrobacter electrodiphilus]
MSDIHDLIQVGLLERSYSIHFGENILSQVGEELKSKKFPSKLAIITNDRVFPLYGNQIKASLVTSGYECHFIVVPDGEQFKSLSTLESIYDQLIEGGFDRGCGILALGGGVVGDMAGYAAASFLRGIPFVQVPTTILSQVDSSVGGKTGVNHRLGKNLIGAFYQPKLVLIDIMTLQTLDPREIRAGIAEIIKYGVIYDANFFAWLENNVDKLLRLDSEALLHAVKRSCQIKADIVEIDEREGSIRALLNYGHTFGHAIEALCGYGEWRHGEAVACGMIVASKISQNLGLSDGGATRRIEELLRRFNLPIKVPIFDLKQYVEAMSRDKKVRAGNLTMVLNLGIGRAKLVPVSNVEDIFRTALPELEA